MDTKTLVGLDVYEQVKSLCDKFLYLGITPDMTDREEKAYKAGASAVLSLLDQLLNDMFVNGEDGLIVHVPGLDAEEEFYDIDEIIERMEEI